MTDAERALRAMLAARAEDAPEPADLWPAVRRRHRQHRVLLATGAAVVLVAAGTPTALIATRPSAGDRAAVPSADPGPPVPCPVGAEQAPADPRLPAQRDVRGSLGGDPAVVDAVLRTGWAQAQAVRIGHGALTPSGVRVELAQRTGDGWIVGLVTVSGGGSYGDVLVAGPAVDDLGAQSSGVYVGGDPPPADDAYVGVWRQCGPERLVVAAPPGSAATLLFTRNVRADATVDRTEQSVPLLPDGTAVIDRPAPGRSVTVRVTKDGRTIGGEDLSGQTVTGLDRADLTGQLATAPGGGGTAGLAILQQQYSVLPVAQSDVRVLWSNLTNGRATVAAAVSRLDGGAYYVWGGVEATDRKGAIDYFDGLVASGDLDRTAFQVTRGLSGVQVVFFAGTRQVEVTNGGSTAVTTGHGGLVVPATASVTVYDDQHRPLPLVDVRTLPRL